MHKPVHRNRWSGLYLWVTHLLGRILWRIHDTPTSYMHKSLKQIKLTFTFLSLLILLVVSLVLFLTQIALAQVPATDSTLPTTPVETRAANPLPRQSATGTSPVRATTSAPVRSAVSDTLEARRAQLEDRRAVIEVRKAEHRAVLKEAAQTRVTAIMERVVARSTASIDSLSAITARVRGYAETLSTRGIDVSTERATLDSIDMILDDARASLAGSDVDIEFVTTSDTPRVDWSHVRARFAAVRDSLKEARALLKETVTALKQSRQSSVTE